MITDSVPAAWDRMSGHYDYFQTPSGYLDGGYSFFLPPVATPEESLFRSMIEESGTRRVANMDLEIECNWLSSDGSVEVVVTILYSQLPEVWADGILVTLPDSLDMGLVFDGTADTVDCMLINPGFEARVVIDSIAFQDAVISVTHRTLPDTLYNPSDTSRAIGIGYDPLNGDPIETTVYVYSSHSDEALDSFLVTANDNLALYQSVVDSLLSDSSISSTEIDSADSKGNDNGVLDLGDMLLLLKGGR